MLSLGFGVEKLVFSTLEKAVDVSCSIADGLCTVGAPVASTLLPPSFPQPDTSVVSISPSHPGVPCTELDSGRETFTSAVHEAAARGASRYKSSSPQPWDTRNPLEIERQIQELSLQRSRLVREKDDLNDSLGQLRAQITGAQVRQSELSTHAQALQVERSGLLSSCLVARARLRDENFKVAAAQVELHETGSKLVKVKKSLTKVEATVKSTEERLQSLTADIATANSDLDAIRSKRDRMAEATVVEKEALRDIENEVSDARRNLGLLRTDMSTTQKKAERAEAQAKNTLSSLQSQIDSARLEATDVQTRIDELGTAEDSLRTEVMALDSDRGRIQAEIDNGRVKVKDMNRLADDITLAMEERRAALLEIETEIVDAESRRETAIAQADEAEVRIRSRNEMAVDLDFKLSAVFRDLDDVAAALKMSENRLAIADAMTLPEAIIPLPASRSPSNDGTISISSQVLPNANGFRGRVTSSSDSFGSPPLPSAVGKNDRCTDMQTGACATFDQDRHSRISRSIDVHEAHETITVTLSPSSGASTLLTTPLEMGTDYATLLCPESAADLDSRGGACSIADASWLLLNLDEAGSSIPTEDSSHIQPPLIVEQINFRSSPLSRTASADRPLTCTMGGPPLRPFTSDPAPDTWSWTRNLFGRSKESVLESTESSG